MSRTLRMMMCLLPALAAAAAGAAPLRIVATTTLIADVARQIAGPGQPVESLLPPDTDPHAFHPSPRDFALLARADLVLVNGLGLESFLVDPLAAAATGKVVVVSRTIRPRALAAAEHGHEEASAHAHEGEQDPHVWFDPERVAQWVDVIESELAARAPAEADAIHGRARAFRAVLLDLDAWARQRLAAVPEPRRKLVTDHDAFGYFAERYGLTVVGCVLPGFSSAAEASARDLAALHDVVRAAGVRTIFVEEAADPRVARQLADATGARLVALPTCSLGAPGGPAATYPQFFRHVVESVARGLER